MMDTDGSKSSSSGRLSKLFGSKFTDKMTEEDIMCIVESARDKHIILNNQFKMIENILKFKSATVADIMTHRVDIKAVEENSVVADVLKVSAENGVSRVPVYKDDIDNIVGAVYVKDLLGLVCGNNAESKKIGQFVREIPYVPETIKCSELFEQLTEKHRHFAVVVDEYGGTSGIVTLEDVLEAIVGEIQDEYDNEFDDIVKINDTTFVMQGSANLEDISEMLNINIKITSDFDTIGGFLVDKLGVIPTENEHPVVKYDNVEFTVLVVKDRHISKVRAIKLQ